MADESSVQFIVNPISGVGQGRILLAQIRRLLDRSAVPSTVRVTRGPGDAGRFAAECRSPRIRAVVVVGGDGTVQDVVNGLGDTGPPVLVVPGGNENILAKYLRTVSEAEWLMRVLMGGRTVCFDAAAVNGRRFLLVAGLGFDTDVVRRVIESRRGHVDYASYFWPMWRTFWTYRHPAMRVEADGEWVSEGPSLVFLGVVPRYGMGLRICARARADDGLLDVCVLRCRGRLSLLRHATNVAMRRHLDAGGVAYRQARRVRVTVDRTTGLEVDGEWAGTIPTGGEAVFEVIPAAARFLVSREWRP